MLVHPVLLSEKRGRWHFPLAVTLLILILVLTIVRGPNQVVNAVQISSSSIPTQIKLNSHSPIAISKTHQLIPREATHETVAASKLELNPARVSKQKSYVWISDEGRGFGIEESGEIKFLGNQ